MYMYSRWVCGERLRMYSGVLEEEGAEDLLSPLWSGFAPPWMWAYEGWTGEPPRCGCNSGGALTFLRRCGCCGRACGW